MGSVLFVHGTGVRQEGYRATVERITRGLQAVAPGALVQPCLWGPEVGATLALNGRSIPDFEGVTTLEEGAEARVLLWELLCMDPTYELRELAARPENGIGRVDATVNGWPCELEKLSTDPTVLALLPAEVPRSLWLEAVAAAAAAPAMAAAARAARRVNTAVREAAARACVAGLLARLRKIEAPPLSEDERDALVRKVVDQLGGRDAGLVSDWIGDKLKGAVGRWATTTLVRRRDVLSNAAYPAAGDILRYQARGAPLRRFIADRIDNCPGDDVTVIAHSLGGIACVDLLAMASRPRVKQLVTEGSQSPLLYELGALRALNPRQPLPEHFPRHWVNVYDRHDLLSYLAAPVFGGHAKRTILDIEVKSGQPFPDAHSAYWGVKNFWPALLQRLLPL